MKPNKLQFNEDQKKSISIAKGSPQAKRSGAIYSRFGREWSMPADTKTDLKGKLQENDTERKTFTRAGTSVKALEEQQTKYDGKLDMPVSGDALARAKSGKPAKIV
jgi:hypothetical protein